MTFNIAQISEDSLMESDGIGLIVWFQGCARALKGNACKGCHNPDLQPFEGGLETTTEIFETYDLSWIDNFILLGGEPVDQEKGMIEVCEFAHAHGKKVWLYTGYFFEDLNPIVVNNVDVVIDGPYIEEMKDKKLPYRGSSNQKMYMKKDEVWIEIHR